jgi:2-haloacid dehalogenase
MSPQIKALLFDVFGTVVDWRSSVATDLSAFFTPRGVTRDWTQMAVDWRGMYQPAMEAVRGGTRDYVILDDLHRENLDALLKSYDLTGLSAAELDHINRAWHRLHPWPDSVKGLKRLRKRFILATASNGNTALMVNLARFGGLPWDAILGAAHTHSYKPTPQTYLGTAKALGLTPAECMMVAAHNDDLAAAQTLGFATAFVCRPTEHGPAQTTDLHAESDWDYVCDSMIDLAEALTQT